MAAFVTNDAAMKFVSGSLRAWQLLFVRGLCGAVALLFMIPFTVSREQATREFRASVLFRASIDAIGTMCCMVALFQIPIIDANVISMARPAFSSTAGDHFSQGAPFGIAVVFLGVPLVVHAPQRTR